LAVNSASSAATVVTTVRSTLPSLPLSTRIVTLSSAPYSTSKLKSADVSVTIPALGRKRVVDASIVKGLFTASTSSTLPTPSIVVAKLPAASAMLLAPFTAYESPVMRRFTSACAIVMSAVEIVWSGGALSKVLDTGSRWTSVAVRPPTIGVPACVTRRSAEPASTKYRWRSKLLPPVISAFTLPPKTHLLPLRSTDNRARG